jgi:hypothetical protein
LRTCRRQEKAKWVHHCLKTIHKALKKAKLQEIKVVTRRFKKAQQLAQAAGGRLAGAAARAGLQRSPALAQRRAWCQGCTWHG